MFEVGFKSKSLKQMHKLDKSLKIAYIKFFATLAENPFIGKLSEDTYHAHVKYHWVAVWTVDKENQRVTVTYVGSREDAPY